MWNPISLTIKNLFSYEYAHFEFKNGEITVIYGENLTDPNTISSGSGKSSILDCMYIGISGETLRGIVKDDIIRNGEENGETTFVLRNDISGVVLKTVSKISHKESSKVEIYENGVLNEPMAALKATEGYKHILSLIGISKEDLINYFLISKEKYKSFFKNGDTDKKEIINRFSKADIVDNVNPFIEEDIKLLDAALKELNDQYIANESVLLHVNDELDKEKIESSIEQTRKLTIDNYKDKIVIIEKDLLTLPEKIKNKENDIQSVDSLIAQSDKKCESLTKSKELADSQVAELEEKIEKINEQESKLDKKYDPMFENCDKKIAIIEQEIVEYEQSIKETNKEIKEIEGILAGKIECPKCEHEFILNETELSVPEAELLLTQLTDLVVDINGMIKDSNANLEIINEEVVTIKNELELKSKDFVNNKKVHRTQLNEFNSMLVDINKNLRYELDFVGKEKKKKSQLEIDLDKLQKQNKASLDQIKEYENLIEVEKNKEYPDKILDLKTKIETLSEQNINLKSEIDILQSDKNSLLEWQIRFKQFKSFLANTSISAIENMMNFYFKEMRTNLSVIIEGFRELSNKKLKEEITTLVCRDGLNGENFKKFSGGEKAKVDLAGILSMQKLINLSVPGKGLNLTFIDEILEGADEAIMKSVIKALSLLNQTIFIITHVSPDSSYDCNKLEVKKIKGISMIKEENDIRKVEEQEAIQKSTEDDLKTDDGKEKLKPRKKIKEDKNPA